MLFASGGVCNQPASARAIRAAVCACVVNSSDQGLQCRGMRHALQEGCLVGQPDVNCLHLPATLS